MITLQTLGAAGDVGSIFAVLAAYLVFVLILGLAGYIFLSLVYMAIGKKANLSSPGLAWIPGIGPLIIAFQASKMHWWPWLLLIVAFLPIINLVFVVFAIIWHWKMFEAVGKPGWWAILLLIPIVNIIMLAIAAWSK